MKYLLIGAITLYQKTFSPDHGWLKDHHPYGFCRFYPSCSEYTLLQVEKFGTVKGLVLGALRIFACNPFQKPTYIPVKSR